MPKLILRERRFGMLNRRLVTDAGGAPCCCGASCQCEPGMILAPFRYVGCRDNRYFNWEPTTTARLVTVRLTWAMSYSEYVVQTVDRITEVTARQQTYSGSATLCGYRFVGVNSYIWVIADALSALTYQRGGSVGETIDESANYEGALALSAWSPGRTTERDLYSVFGLGSVLTFAPTYSYPRLGAYTEAANVPRDACNISATISENRPPTYTESGSINKLYVASENGGTYTFNASSNVNGRHQVRTAQNVQWGISYDSCDGETAPSRPGGCAGCGDAGQLQIL